MSAAVICGSKRSFFEDLPSSAPFSNKRRRCSSYTSPIGFPASYDDLLDQLRSLFPDMDPQMVLGRALEESGHDIDDAIRRLHKLRLAGSSQEKEKEKEKANSAPAQEQADDTTTTLSNNDEAAAAEPSPILENENMILKKENAVLRRLVCVQYQRRKEYEEERNQEVQHLKQLVSEYKEKVTTLEVKNYALTMHLKQADQQSMSIPGRFHPDIC